MPARYLSDTKLARLSRPGEIADEDTVSYFTLSADDLAWLAGFNREENRLGVAVQLAGCPGWVGSPTISPTARWLPDPVRLALVRQLRQGTLRAANIRLVNAHHVHPLAALWVSGSLSSSDGTAVPAARPQPHRPALPRYFLDEGTTTYTHVSDQHSTYGTKVIPTTWREAVAVLDEIFGNVTDLLRLVASMKFGHTTASLLIAQLHPSSRQSSLAKALHEYGQLIRMIYLGRYVADEELRRRVRRQVNKGESLRRT